MKSLILAAAASVSLAAPVLAQTTTVTPPSDNSIVRTPDNSASGAGSGMSGNVGSPGSTYPGRLRDLNSPSTEFGINSPSTEFGARPLGLPRR